MSEQENEDDFFDGPEIEEDFGISEDAIEQAYMQALRASEEAGLMPEAPYSPLEEEYEEALAEWQGESSPKRESTPVESASGIEESSSRKPRFRPEQIIEALLFVGGEKFPARKLASLLGQYCEEVAVREWIEQINEKYRQQERPYEIILGEDGYQMSLRLPFQPLRHQLFGLGPREVKLSQETLEVLAFVAYQQPVSQSRIMEIDRPQVASALRQLVRRELISVERGEGEDNEPVYRTTSRFLSLFGLNQLTDLPRTRDLAFK